MMKIDNKHQIFSLFFQIEKKKYEKLLRLILVFIWRAIGG